MAMVALKRLMVLGWLLAATCAAAEPINIGSRRELFVDRYLVETVTGAARFQLHRPRETDDVFRARHALGGQTGRCTTRCFAMGTSTGCITGGRRSPWTERATRFLTT